MIKYSGSAFPYVSIDGFVEEGISVRDYFAAHAPKIPSWFLVEHSEKCRDTPEIIAKWSYEYADSMIKESEKS